MRLSDAQRTTTPDDSELQAAILNKAYGLAEELLAILAHVEKFAAAYLPTDDKV